MHKAHTQTHAQTGKETSRALTVTGAQVAQPTHTAPRARSTMQPCTLGAWAAGRTQPSGCTAGLAPPHACGAGAPARQALRLMGPSRRRPQRPWPRPRAPSRHAPCTAPPWPLAGSGRQSHHHYPRACTGTELRSRPWLWWLGLGFAPLPHGCQGWRPLGRGTSWLLETGVLARCPRCQQRHPGCTCAGARRNGDNCGDNYVVATG
jgi:hypothetical protein